jgi:hypothetical protein
MVETALVQDVKLVSDKPGTVRNTRNVVLAIRLSQRLDVSDGAILYDRAGMVVETLRVTDIGSIQHGRSDRHVPPLLREAAIMTAICQECPVWLELFGHAAHCFVSINGYTPRIEGTETIVLDLGFHFMETESPCLV